MKTDPVERILEFGSRKIPYRLHRAKRKHLRIVVSPELMIDIFAPESVSDETLQVAITKKAPWVARTIDKLQRYHPLPTPKNYLSGETFIYLGRQYRLKIESGSRQPAKLLGRFLHVWAEDRFNTESVKKSVEAWYQKRARETMGRYMEKCQAVTSRHGIPETTWMIRNMRRRWGSCSPSGRITLNINLVKVPVQCIEYVIMHELCHLKNHNHSKAFYALLTRCLPDWRQRKETLDKFRLS